MRTLTLPGSVFNAKLQPFRKNSLKSFTSSSSLPCLDIHPENQKKNHVNLTLVSSFSRNSGRWSGDANVDEEWNGLSRQTSTTNAHDVPEHSLFYGGNYKATLGATRILNGSGYVDACHNQISSSSEDYKCTSFNLEDVATSLMSSLSWLKFPMLISLLTLLDSQQALAGSEFATGLQSITYLGDLGDISTGFASVRKTSL